HAPDAARNLLHLLSAQHGPGAIRARVGDRRLKACWFTSIGTHQARAFPGLLLFVAVMIAAPVREISTPAALVGRTPLVRLRAFEPRPGVEIHAKLESHNPGGSVKDRAALAMI